MEALREDLLEHGAVELGVDLAALEVILIEQALQVDTHSPTAAPTPVPTAALTSPPIAQSSRPGDLKFLSIVGATMAVVGVCAVTVGLLGGRSREQKPYSQKPDSENKTVKNTLPTPTTESTATIETDREKKAQRNPFSFMIWLAASPLAKCTRAPVGRRRTRVHAEV